ncbi:hypothetical protein HZY97_04565 [Sphingomonas sp. R-74633]|uniref:hypothetical protein n=1 Tax=Sphingomonas sp. R-74633 TaxID=2751188 RepID=UPI0015D3DEA3|nr:hypothetical protein [Sphingomonas sp. R-74633]NYT40017.1 hypothetical protein [Sphingomonas sp. R-74633]
MTRLAAMLFSLPLLFAAPAATAQTVTTAARMSPLLAARVAALPDTLAGLLRDDGNDESGHPAPMVAYHSINPQDPVITVVLADAKSPIPWPDMAENGRAGPRQAGLIDTLFEGKFSLDGHPKTRNFFGDYLTKQGIKQSWIADIDGVRVTILATIYRAEDRRKVFDAIRRDLLGGITMEKVSTAEAN